MSSLDDFFTLSPIDDFFTLSPIGDFGSLSPIDDRGPLLARTPQDLGLLIRDQRIKLGLGQGELAKLAGVGRQWLVGVEKGKPRADVGLILRTLSALGLEVDVRPLARTSSNDLEQVLSRARGKKV